jgi:hypothetical protein
MVRDRYWEFWAKVELPWRRLYCRLRGHQQEEEYTHMTGSHFFCGRCGEELD